MPATIHPVSDTAALSSARRRDAVSTLLQSQLSRPRFRRVNSLDCVNLGIATAGSSRGEATIDAFRETSAGETSVHFRRTCPYSRRTSVRHKTPRLPPFRNACDEIYRRRVDSVPHASRRGKAVPRLDWIRRSRERDKRAAKITHGNPAHRVHSYRHIVR